MIGNLRWKRILDTENSKFHTVAHRINNIIVE